MDDGVDYMHPDLINNFVSFLHDYNIFNVFFLFRNLLVYTINCFEIKYGQCVTKGVYHYGGQQASSFVCVLPCVHSSIYH
jgi:hypothetical protein